MSGELENKFFKGSNPKKPYKRGLLHTRTVNQTIADAKELPTPLRLFGSFVYEGEVTILFSDTNLGKSILAVQIADIISKGIKDEPFGSEAIEQSVVLLDFELSDKQFEKRYSVEYEKHYFWSPLFHRSKIDTSFTDYENAEEQLFFDIEQTLREKSCRVLIVDNITYLKRESTEKGGEAQDLMKRLVALKNSLAMTIIVVAHTPKRKDIWGPLSLNDLAGSKNLSNFADSIFAIGKSSRGDSMRYIKLLKSRNDSVTDKVWVCSLEKPFNFMQFKYECIDDETNHLMPRNQVNKELEKKILATKAEHPEWSLRAIAEELQTNHMKVGRVLKSNKV